MNGREATAADRYRRRQLRSLDVADNGALGAGERLLAALSELAQGVGNLGLVGLAPGSVGDGRAGGLRLLDGLACRGRQVSLDKVGGRREERGRLGDNTGVRGRRSALVELVRQVGDGLLQKGGKERASASIST